MKRIAILILCAVLVSCSKDDDNTLPVNGQYITNALDFVASINVSNGECNSVTVFIKGEYFNQWHGSIITIGKYPKYRYYIDELEMQVVFTGVDNFNAILSGVLTSADGNGQTAIDATPAILFKLDNRALDANGDGILDSTQ